MTADLRRSLLGAAVALWLASGCAKTVVRPQTEATTTRLPRPEVVMVYDPAVSEAEVQENQGFFEQVWNSGTGETQSEREREIGRQAAGAFAEELVSGIRELGLPAQRAKRGTPVASNTLLVSGQFLNVDEGNRLRRLVIGFGAGGSKVDTQVQVQYAGQSGLTKLLEFTTHADSGKMPGAAVTMGGGAAAQGGVTAGMAAANVAVGGVKAYRTQAEKMSAYSAEQAVAYLSEYFAKQGWIAPGAVKKAKRADE